MAVNKKEKGEDICPKEPEKRATFANPKPSEESKKLGFRQLPDGLFVLYWEGGGELPQVLSGRYTGMNKAIKAIDYYYSIQRIR